MSQGNYLTRLKELPESVRQFGGLVIIINPTNCLTDSGNSFNLVK